MNIPNDFSESTAMNSGDSPAPRNPIYHSLHEYTANDCDEPGEKSQLERTTELLARILRAQSRFEQIRLNLENVDCMMLRSRSVQSLLKSVTRYLEDTLDLITVRVLIAANQEPAFLFERAPQGGGVISPEHCVSPEHVRILSISHEKERCLFFEDVSELVVSAAIADLVYEGRSIGVLCLGSHDPDRYTTLNNTAVIASLAKKITLGIMNAWDHEKKVSEVQPPVRDNGAE